MVSNSLVFPPDGITFVDPDSGMVGVVGRVGLTVLCAGRCLC